MSGAIAIRGLELTLGEGPSRVRVLCGVDLDVASGEAVAVLGPSGSGKSTLLMAIAGLERADRGSIRVAATEISGLGEDRLAAFRGRNIGIVFQSFHLIANMTALENVAVPLELAGVGDAFGRAADELAAVGLGQRLSHYPGQLSGGEQQRVAVARALAPRPAILVADEPTGNLDAETGRQVADLIFARQRALATTLLLVTHDLALAGRCDRVVRMRSGAIDVASEKEARHRNPARSGAR